MPYVRQEIRPALDTVSEAMRDADLTLKDIERALFEACRRHVEPSYNNYKNWCGELAQCAAEIRRRFAGDPSTVGFNELKYKVFLPDPRKSDSLADLLRHVDADGCLNYVLFKYCRINAPSYREISTSLLCAADRVTAELLAPYEDAKIEENGDVT